MIYNYVFGSTLPPCWKMGLISCLYAYNRCHMFNLLLMYVLTGYRKSEGRQARQTIR